MDPKSSPQVTDTNTSSTSAEATTSQTQTPILETIPPVEPTDATSPSASTTPNADKQEQEAAATVTMTPNAQQTGSSNSPKIIIGILIALVLIVMSVLGYYMMIKMSDSSASQTYEVVTPAPTKPVVSPTPQTEEQEVDALDTTFPESEVNAIQKDLQGL